MTLPVLDPNPIQNLQIKGANARALNPQDSYILIARLFQNLHVGRILLHTLHNLAFLPI